MPERPRVWSCLDAEARAQFWATLALRHTQGLGVRTGNRLLRAFGSAHAALDRISDWSGMGVASEVAARAAAGAWRATAQEEWNAAQTTDAHIVLWHDAVYPARLRELADAPLLLYCMGDTALLSAPSVAVVGSRDCTVPGMRVAEEIARNLSASGITVISGMALGIDTAAHTAALSGSGKSIGVLGTGIDKVYPAGNLALRSAMLQSGLIATEFSPGSLPLAAHFPIRNRIISGLSLGVLVVEAALRSGSLITARLALEQNRDVFAIPGPASAAASLGCQELIRQGARPVFNADDIIRDLAPQLTQFGIEEIRTVAYTAIENGGMCATSSLHARPMEKGNMHMRSPSSKEAQQVLSALYDKSCVFVDDICTLTGLPAFKVNSLLVSLEIDGYVRRLPGSRYVPAS